MQPGKSPLTGPLWVIAIGILIGGIGVFYMADIQRQRTRAASEELETVRTEIEQQKLALTNTKVTAPVPPPANPSRAVIIATNAAAPAPAAPATNAPTTAGGAPSRQTALASQGSATVGSLAGTDGGLQGRVTLTSTPPPEKPLPLDPACGKLHPGAQPMTRFYVTGAENGLADVLVYVKSGFEGKEFTVQDVPLVIDQKGCEYLPYISAALVNQTIIIKNSDPILHNVHPTPTVGGNPESNRAQLPKGPDLRFAFPKPEMFIRFKCDVHPWMFSYVSILPHPFFVVTDASGEFQFPQPLPPGDYVIEAIHRKAGAQEKRITVGADGRVPQVAFEFTPR
jgi:hypothetical protein